MIQPPVRATMPQLEFDYARIPKMNNEYSEPLQQALISRIPFSRWTALCLSSSAIAHYSQQSCDALYQLGRTRLRSERVLGCMLSARFPPRGSYQIGNEVLRSSLARRRRPLAPLLFRAT